MSLCLLNSKFCFTISQGLTLNCLSFLVFACDFEKKETSIARGLSRIV